MSSTQEARRAAMEREARTEIQSFIETYLRILRGPVEGEKPQPPTTRELLLGVPYYGGGFAVDFKAAVFMPLSKSPAWKVVPPSTKRLIADISREGDRDFDRLMKIAKGLKGIVDGSLYSFERMQPVREALERVRIYLADDHEPEATVAILRRAHDLVALRGYSAFWSILTWCQILELGCGQFVVPSNHGLTEDEVRTDLFARLRDKVMGGSNAPVETGWPDLLYEVLGDMRAGVQPPAGGDKAVKKFDPDVEGDVTKLIDDVLGKVPDVPDDFDAPEPEVAKPPPKPTLVVIRSLAHLPGGSATGRTSSSSRQDAAVEFNPLVGPLPLAETPDLGDVGSWLEGRYPWAVDAIRTMLSDVVGKATVRLKPTLLVGPPGCGKTSLAKDLARELTGDQSPTVYSCGGSSDAAFGGTSRQWGSGRASVPLQTVRRLKIANPVLILDEIEKDSPSKHNGRLSDVLLGFLERGNAQAYFDLYLECPVDLSAVTYIATANSLDTLDKPLRDRFRILDIPLPSPEHVPAIAAAAVQARRQEDGEDATWLPDLAPDEVDLVVRSWRETPERSRSLRRVRRAVDAIITGRRVLAGVH